MNVLITGASRGVGPVIPRRLAPPGGRGSHLPGGPPVPESSPASSPVLLPGSPVLPTGPPVLSSSGPPVLSSGPPVPVGASTPVVPVLPSPADPPLGSEPHAASSPTIITTRPELFMSRRRCTDRAAAARAMFWCGRVPRPGPGPTSMSWRESS